MCDRLHRSHISGVSSGGVIPWMCMLHFGKLSCSKSSVSVCEFVYLVHKLVSYLIMLLVFRPLRVVLQLVQRVAIHQGALI